MMALEYLLVVLYCNPLTNGDCHWQREGYFRTEERCAVAGLALGTDRIARFKCVVQDATPVPLPRPRPAGGVR